MLGCVHRTERAECFICFRICVVEKWGIPATGEQLRVLADLYQEGVLGDRPEARRDRRIRLGFHRRMPGDPALFP